MDKQNKNILNIIKTKGMAFIIIFISQIIGLFLFNILISEFINDVVIKNAILGIVIFIFLIVDFIFYKLHISRAMYFLNVNPIECIIEDFLIVSYGYIENALGYRRKDYRIYPIVRVDNELYFTYGDYCVSYYNEIYNRINNEDTNIMLFRKDKSEVKIGDKAYLYIKKKVDVDIKIDKSRNEFMLNKQVENFKNFNTNNDINILQELNFFEGFIDVE